MKLRVWERVRRKESGGAALVGVGAEEAVRLAMATSQPARHAGRFRRRGISGGTGEG